jgi:hypothetical protein
MEGAGETVESSWSVRIRLILLPNLRQMLVGSVPIMRRNREWQAFQRRTVGRCRFGLVLASLCRAVVPENDSPVEDLSDAIEFRQEMVSARIVAH